MYLFFKKHKLMFSMFLVGILFLGIAFMNTSIMAFYPGMPW
ncbi:hypothetical protein CLROS_011770 [Clostridium felsineum]|uniref:Uncharacterized protein n=1 Tax=Clostridium felsineum TaxID=36839 RepID=A0A1S8LPP8_9CLOT|nr:hypothetical protein CLAUR_013080 [Clostridium felsineum]URZ05846.1 hypothetical protein CLROS_011770 [Clostridium felsineum]URZ10883.1 hypothetical protein CROST_015980 [Clostridium felsineum]